ncbi:hypothetical protein [Tessaracoccus sp. OH4464_COT-324]|uniref:hypothetical protein n=1 Tax=Tessaracoccus sp. OH4464_COT-324 TaxID=2491059 RepID=UPI000F62D740|nr:hypothetical protein [Tessaracoccus sp. OH4464_COT-324]RRD47154.1 hypothetical protein EII42_04010 [Tessaracoccus sp. OH4464_COT-324]
MKEILTFPPIEQRPDGPPLSPRTGEPRRPATMVIAVVLAIVGVAVVGWVYGWHWFRAAFPETYPGSAHLTRWVEPEPGAWVSLTFEVVYAALVVLAAGAIGIIGYNAWHGRRWVSLGALAAVALNAALLLVSWHALIPLGVALGLVLMVWLPATRRYFDLWDVVRARRPEPYRRPERVFYGRLPRYQ